MSVTIDTNLYAIQSRLNISSARMNQYTDKTVEEVIEAEAAQGNTKALEYEKVLLNNPKEFVEMFELSSVDNKYNLLMGLNENELAEMLEYLDPEDLRMGLNFFTQEKLLKLLQEIPIEQLVNVTNTVFKLDEIMEMMPSRELDKFMTSDKLEKEFLLKYVAQLPPEAMAAMLETATGEPVNNLDPKYMMSKISELDKDEYKEAMLSINPDLKRSMVMNMSADKPEVMQLFSSESYTNMLGTLQKPDMMEGMIAIEKEQLIDMNSQLPQELMSIVLTQMNTEDFAKIILEKHPEILAEIVAV